MYCGDIPFDWCMLISMLKTFAVDMSAPVRVLHSCPKETPCYTCLESSSPPALPHISTHTDLIILLPRMFTGIAVLLLAPDCAALHCIHSSVPQRNAERASPGGLHTKEGGAPVPAGVMGQVCEVV